MCQLDNDDDNNSDNDDDEDDDDDDDDNNDDDDNDDDDDDDMAVVHLNRHMTSKALMFQSPSRQSDDMCQLCCCRNT